MKKHKRDPEQRSYVKGYQAAIQGRSLSICPHQENTKTAFQWSRGWREGRQDGWSGFNRETCQKKATNLALNQ
ncbi:MAG TPA: ribosome modulation factor [Porticoccaceae bacterium]|jgi:ribosome modulation factor|nr:ribosome modulation factor [Porticoccaceae bacterium]